MKTFEAMDAALAMITTVRPVIERIERRDRDLGRQLRRTTASVASNLAEGNRRTGGDRLYLWKVGLGSAEEAKVQLRIARAWGYCAGAKLDESDAALDRMCALLYRLTTPRP